jgi:hypothetical protein
MADYASIIGLITMIALSLGLLAFLLWLLPQKPDAPRKSTCAGAPRSHPVHPIVPEHRKKAQAAEEAAGLGSPDSTSNGASDTGSISDGGGGSSGSF